MDISSVSRISGLTRGQIDQAISRWAITPQSKSARGTARRFSPSDVFAFAIVGELKRIDLPWPVIRDLYWSYVSRPDVGGDEIFPDCDRFADAVIAFWAFGPDRLPENKIIERSELSKLGTEATIVLPAGRIAKRVRADIEASAR